MDIYIWKYRRLWGLMTCGKRIYSSSNYLLRKILKGNFLLIALFSLFYVKDSELHVLCCYIWKTSLGHIDIRLLDSKQLDFWESKQLERERERKDQPQNTILEILSLSSWCNRPPPNEKTWSNILINLKLIN